MQHASDCAVNNDPALPAGECDCSGVATPSTAERRVAVLEDRIRYALTMAKIGCWAAVQFELDRALNDPDFQ